MKELRKIVGPDIAIVIAGNKCDLEKQRNVDHEEAVKCVVPVTGSALLCAVWCSHVDCGCGCAGTPNQWVPSTSSLLPNRTRTWTRCS